MLGLGLKLRAQLSPGKAGTKALTSGWDLG